MPLAIRSVFAAKLASRQTATNMASIHVEQREFELALTAIAKGLAMDQNEQYRKAFLQLQNDLLIALSQVHARQQYQLVNRVRVLGQAPEAALPGTS